MAQIITVQMVKFMCYIYKDKIIMTSLQSAPKGPHFTFRSCSNAPLFRI